MLVSEASIAPDPIRWAGRVAALAVGLALTVAGCSDDPARVETTGLGGVVREDLDGDGRGDVAGVDDRTGEAVARFACGDTATEIGLIEKDLMIEAVELVSRGASLPPAILTTARTGAAGGAVSARAVAFKQCGQDREVFRYPPPGEIVLPRGGEAVVDAIVQSEGDRLLVVERIARRGEPTCCPSIERTTRFGYRSDAFRRESSSLRRLPTGPG